MATTVSLQASAFVPLGLKFFWPTYLTVTNMARRFDLALWSACL